MQLEVEPVDLISQSSGSRKLLEVEWVYIVDSGGQPQFHKYSKPSSAMLLLVSSSQS